MDSPDLGRRPRARRRAGRLVLALTVVGSLASTAEATFPGTNGRLAFTRYDGDGGNGQIYVMNADGSGLVKLSSSTAHDDQYPAWSPDHARIAFVSNRDGNDEIYVMNADGTSPARLTNDAAHDWYPVWSPDGTRIAFTTDRDGNWEIYVMNADGSGPTNLTNDPSLDFHCAWSPDGSKIVFSSDRGGVPQIYTMSPDGTGVTDLTNDTIPSTQPSYSPDGSKIVYTASVGVGADFQIFVMNADGSGQQSLSTGGHWDWFAAWSPDGTKIAFTTNRDGGNEEIYVMNADGTNPVDVSNDAAPDFDPDWETLAPAGPMVVPVDVKPGSCPNVFNPTKHGSLGVAIAGSASLDVTTIDADTIRLEGVAPSSSAVRDVTTPYTSPNGAPSSCDQCTALGPDGTPDLNLVFDSRAVGAALGDTKRGQCRVVHLVGMLRDGTPITGEDVLTISGR